MTYQCDLQLPTGLINRTANVASEIANRITASAANLIVTITNDYASHSDFLRRYLEKVRVAPPPVSLAQVNEDFINEVRTKYGVEGGQKVIGMVARLAAEKGVEYLVRAMPKVLEEHPQTRVLFAGQNENVMGEEAYAAMLAPMIEELGDRWKFLGIIPDEELTAFYHICDVITVPSTNSTEAFGLVQVEAMTCGTPAVASDIPGVRQPVLQTGMGKVFPLRNAEALAEALIDILDAPEKYRGDVPAISKRFAPDSTAQEYEAIFKELLG